MTVWHLSTKREVLLGYVLTVSMSGRKRTSRAHKYLFPPGKVKSQSCSPAANLPGYSNLKHVSISSKKLIVFFLNGVELVVKSYII